MENYKLSENAIADLRRIYLHGLEQFGEALADSYYDKLFDHFEKIAQNPYMYVAVADVKIGYRRCVCGVDNIYYRISGSKVEIMRVLGQQDTRTHL